MIQSDEWLPIHGVKKWDLEWSGFGGEYTCVYLGLNIGGFVCGWGISVDR